MRELREGLDGLKPRASSMARCLRGSRKQRASIQRSVSLLAPALGRTLASLPQQKQSSMDRAIDQTSISTDYGAFKASIGVLAIVAAVATGSGTAMTASLLGALAALALSAGAMVSALFELAASDRDRVWRTLA